METDDDAEESSSDVKGEDDDNDDEPVGGEKCRRNVSMNIFRGKKLATLCHRNGRAESNGRNGR